MQLLVLGHGAPKRAVGFSFSCVREAFQKWIPLIYQKRNHYNIKIFKGRSTMFRTGIRGIPHSIALVVGDVNTAGWRSGTHFHSDLLDSYLDFEVTVPPSYQGRKTGAPNPICSALFRLPPLRSVLLSRCVLEASHEVEVRRNNVVFAQLLAHKVPHDLGRSGWSWSWSAPSTVVLGDREFASEVRWPSEESKGIGSLCLQSTSTFQQVSFRGLL